MTIQEIETFLAIIEAGTLTGAANKLYLGQSTVSNRIKSLEEELGVRLFYRDKGHRNISLTNAGENFIPIAHQWQALWRNTQLLPNQSIRHYVHIGSVDLINNYTFVPLYKRLIQEHPEICFHIKTHHSGEIYGLLSSYNIDLGFVFSSVNLPDVISQPIYRELMYLVCRKDAPYYDGISPDMLSEKDEVFINWGSDFELWHNTYWPNREFLMSVNTGSLIEHYLTETSTRWAIVPMSLVEMIMKRNPRITHYQLQTPPPPRICYMLTSRYPKTNIQEQIQTIISTMEDFIKSSSSICEYEPWMSL